MIVLNEITTEAFHKETPIEETRERTVCVDQIYLVKKDGAILGYATNDVLDLAGERVNYFSSAIFTDELKSNGMYSELNRLRVECNDCNTIMTRTQNPVVIHSFKNLCDKLDFEFFPGGEIIPKEILDIARDYSIDVDNHLICERVYGRALMDKTPLPRPELQELYKRIDVDDGDAIILIGQSDRAA